MSIPLYDFMAGGAKQVPIVRTGTPADVARTVSYCASEGADILSGHVLDSAGELKS